MYYPYDFHELASMVLQRVVKNGGIYPSLKCPSIYIVKMDSLERAIIETISTDRKIIDNWKWNLIRFGYLGKRKPVGLKLGVRGLEILKEIKRIKNCNSVN